MNRKVIITGCTSGIGRSLLIKLLEDDNNYVIGICRNPKKIEDLSIKYKKNLQLIKCDLLNLVDLKNLIKQLKKISNINILINNCGSLFFENKEVFHGIYGTHFLNTFVPMLLCLEAIENFDIKKKNLVINIGSNAFKLFPVNKEENFLKNYNFSYKNYCKSKLYLMYLTERFSRNIKGNIEFCYTHPGLVKSNISSNFPYIYKFLFKIIQFFFGISSDESANYIINDIINNNLNKNNKFFNFNSRKNIKNLILNKEYSDKIWDIYLKKKLEFDKL